MCVLLLFQQVGTVVYAWAAENGGHSIVDGTPEQSAGNDTPVVSDQPVSDGVPGSSTKTDSEPTEPTVPTDPSESTDSTDPADLPEYPGGAADQEVMSIMRDEAAKLMYAQVFNYKYSDTNSLGAVYVANTCPLQSSQPKGSKFNPYTSLSEAYQYIPTYGGIIILEDDYTSDGTTYSGYIAAADATLISSGWPNIEKPALIYAETNSNGLYIGKNWVFHANVGFYNLTLTVDCEKPDIYANGNTAVFGGEGMNNIAVVLANKNYCNPIIFGGAVENETVAATNLIVNGGSWDRIYGGGAPGSIVKGTATTTVNGLIDNEPSKSSVSLKNKRGAEFQVNDVHIFGGAATLAGSDVKGSVGSIILNVKNYTTTNNNDRWIIHATSGIVDGNVICNIDNCTLRAMGRGRGKGYKDMTFNIKGCTIGNLTMIKNTDYGAGFGADSDLIINCTDSSLDKFTKYESELNAAGYYINASYYFENCSISSEFSCNHQFPEKADIKNIRCTLKNVTFGSKVKL